MSVAGGDPLVHPEIVEVVRMIASRGPKPVVNTNGHGLTPSLLRDRKAAGLSGFTSHVDSLPTRPGWKGATETELNELRQDYADRVHVVVVIAFRAAPQRNDIDAQEIVDVLQARFPQFEPAAYLSGTEAPDSFKWLMTLLVGDRERFYGSVGPKFVELSQVWNHLVKGRCLGYVPPRCTPAAAACSPSRQSTPGSGGPPPPGRGRWPGTRCGRRAAPRPVGHDHPAGRRPPRRQAVDWSCRLEERLQYGELMRLRPASAPRRTENPPT